MKRVLLFLGFSGIVLLATVANAQDETDPVQIDWSFGEPPGGGWTVGDRIPLRLAVTYPANLEVTAPELPEAWGPFEVQEQTPHEPVQNADGTLTAVREAIVTLWVPGEFQTPPFAVRYRDADGQLHEALAPQLPITVVSVLEQGKTEKRDLKPQAYLPGPSVWPLLLGTVVLTAVLGSIGWVLFARLRHRMTPTSAPAYSFDPRPPHEIAYSELDRIAAINLPVRGELKRHYTLVADCIRTYIQGRYDVPAMDQTTEELTAALRQARMDSRHASLFRELLTEADLVKFAGFRPSIDQAYTATAQARHIVDVTKIDNRIQ